MDYAQNGNLFYFLKNNKTLTQKTIKSIFVQVSEALKYIHQKGIVHRDIKPENILLDKHMEVKLCDFGWSTLQTDVRKTFCGTYEYMAPEIFENLTYNYTVDIWSLGILLFELIHGHSPFRGQSFLDIYKNILKKKIKFSSECPSEAQELIQDILNVIPSQRPSIDNILSHPFLQGNLNSEKSLKKVTKKSLSQIKKQPLSEKETLKTQKRKKFIREFVKQFKNKSIKNKLCFMSPQGFKTFDDTKNIK